MWNLNNFRSCVSGNRDLWLKISSHYLIVIDNRQCDPKIEIKFMEIVIFLVVCGFNWIFFHNFTLNISFCSSSITSLSTASVTRAICKVVLDKLFLCFLIYIVTSLYYYTTLSVDWNKSEINMRTRAQLMDVQIYFRVKLINFKRCGCGEVVVL